MDSLFIGNSAAGDRRQRSTAKGRSRSTGSRSTGNTAIDGGGHLRDGADHRDRRTRRSRENTATGAGGGLYARMEPPSCPRMTIAENEARRAAAASGVPSAAAGDVDRPLVDRRRTTRRPTAATAPGTSTPSAANVGSATRAAACGEPTDRSGDDPQLRRLGPNGGPTPTMALRPTQPARSGSGIECARARPAGRTARPAVRRRRLRARAMPRQAREHRGHARRRRAERRTRARRRSSAWVGTTSSRVRSGRTARAAVRATTC